MASAVILLALSKGQALAATVPTSDPGAFVSGIATAAVGIGGGVALLLVIYGGVMFTMSHGDQEKIREAQEVITSALAGLMLIIFATLILKLIGGDILGLPGMPNFKFF